jgi:hypothetical protein
MALVTALRLSRSNRRYTDGVHYELWDIETRDMLEDFATESEALAAARELIALNLAVYPASLALARWNDDGTTTWVAQGDALGERARAARSRRALSA